MGEREVRTSFPPLNIVIISLVFSLAGTFCEGKSVDPRLGASLLQIDSDPLGEVDTFSTLSEKDRQQWGRLGSTSLADKAKALANLEVATAVEIRLVGFDGEGAESIKLKESDLWRYITALRRDPRIHVLQSEPHSLLLRSSVLFHITKAPRTLSHAMWDAVRLSLEKTKDRFPPILAETVPASVVDDIIADEVRQRSGLLVPTIYVLNPPPQASRYIYGSEKGGQAQFCGGSVWAGTSERYMWVDITSGPSIYGPVFEGEGGTSPKSIPKLAHYGPDNWSKAFVADLVGMVADAAEHMFAPPMDRFPVPYTPLTEVHLIHIREGPALKGTGLEQRDEFGLKEIENIVTTELLLPRQSVRFLETSLSLGDCEFCIAAFGRALRTATRPRDEGPSRRAFQGSLAAAAWEYLDAAELHHWLRVFRRSILTEVGRIHGSFRTVDGQPGTRFIPVFVFDQDTETPAWLDQARQAVAFDDMVIAVRGKGPWQPSGFQCNGQMAMLKPEAVPRALLAALLQTGWGVAPSYETWSVFHNATLHDWLWSVGRTPFGPLSDVLGISFVQRTAAQRNVVLTLLHRAVEEAGEMLRAVQSYGGEQVLLSPARHLEYSQRWGVLAHKLDQCAEALSLLKFPVALYFAQSVRHDLQGLQALLQQGAGELTTVLDCYEEPPFPYMGAGSTIGLVSVAFYVYSKREQLFRNKKKQF